MNVSRRWLLSIGLGLVCFVGMWASKGNAQKETKIDYVYDVVVMDAPPPSGLTDNRSEHSRLAGELSAYVNAQSLNGWEPHIVWGDGPVYVMFRRESP